MTFSVLKVKYPSHKKICTAAKFRNHFKPVDHETPRLQVFFRASLHEVIFWQIFRQKINCNVTLHL